MVDKGLDDGRFVVINGSREDVPVGMVFVEMILESSELVEGAFKSTQLSSASVALKLDAVESWHRSLDAVPYGHNAAIQLSGAHLTELRELLAGRAKHQYVHLATAPRLTGHTGSTSIEIGPRYLSKRTRFSSVTEERTALLASLESAPGVVTVNVLEPHLKGGHRASLVIDKARLDDFIAYMDVQGWMDGL